MKRNERIIIIGNSGSGKTWLGNVLSQRLQIPLFHMDSIRWDSEGYEIKRSPEDIKRSLERIKKKDQWILEGVFGKMAQYCLPCSNLLIWLDLPWDECKKNLLSRGPQFEDSLDPSEREKALTKLIEWASTHQVREDANSWTFFNMLYDKFENKKLCLRSRQDVLHFLEQEEEKGEPS